MKYREIVEGRFKSRPNRFIAYVNIGGRQEKAHVKNTGRCKELLVDNAVVYLEKNEGGKRATAYDLVAVQKGNRLINMDSNAPNKAVGEWLLKKELFPSLKSIRAEKTYKNSRFDFYVETEEEKIFLEVKGVTLERENGAYFPDAPSERALKHVEELIEAVNRLPEFPYAYPAYIPIRTLKNEYRKLLVANYLIFYCVDDCEKVITVARVIYAKRNYHLLLD